MNNDIAMNKLVNTIRKISNQSNKPDTMTFGIVKSVDPLKIDIGNNIILTEEFLFLGQMCRPHKVKIPHTHEYNGETMNSTATNVPVPEGTPIPEGTPTPTQSGDLSITTVGQATTTVIEIGGHKHDIKNQVTEDVHKQGSDYEKSVTIEIEPKLAVGDTVLMFAFNNYQMYYVAERIENEG